MQIKKALLLFLITCSIFSCSKNDDGDDGTNPIVDPVPNPPIINFKISKIANVSPTTGVETTSAELSMTHLVE